MAGTGFNGGRGGNPGDAPRPARSGLKRLLYWLTVLALSLARALGTTVEGLFQLAD